MALEPGKEILQTEQQAGRAWAERRVAFARLLQTTRHPAGMVLVLFGLLLHAFRRHLGRRHLARICLGVVPLVLVVGAVVVAVFQIVLPSSDNTANEAKASAALVGKCLPKSGGHYSSTTVPCTSPKAAVRVASVVPSTPGSPYCPVGTQAMELAYPGVRYPHIECVQPVGPAG